MNAKYSFALLLLIGCVVCGISPIYPVPWFARSFPYFGILNQGYCINDGTYGAAQGSGAQQYSLVQPCQIGQIDTEGDLQLLSFGQIGGVGASYFNLGGPAQIHTDYPTSLWPNQASLAYDAATDAIGFKSLDKNGAVQFIPLNATASQSLLTAAAGVRVSVNQDLVGTIWIVRLTNRDGVSKTISEDCTELVVGYVTNFDNSSVSVEWGVIASIDPAQAIAAANPRKPGGYLAGTYGIAVTALLFSLFVLIVLLAVFAHNHVVGKISGIGGRPVADNRAQSI